MYLEEISPRYTAETYSLLTHNCNNFSNEVAQFLVGASIPDYILQLPNEVMSSPMGALICKYHYLLPAARVNMIHLVFAWFCHAADSQHTWKNFVLWLLLVYV